MARGAVHTIVATECSNSFSLQSLALAYSHKKAKQPGPITRIMACTPRQLKAMTMEELDRMTTHVMPEMPTEFGGDNIKSALSKPSGVLHWLQRARPPEEWVLIVDSGVLFREPIDPAEFNIPQGWARAARFPYLGDLRTELAARHEPSLPVLNDAFGGKPGRRVDEAGSFYLLRRTDLLKLLPLYIKYAEAVYKDPELQRRSGKVSKQGGEAHLAQMIGWSIAMAKLGIHQVVDPALQVHPNRPVRDAPKLTNYGMLPRLENTTVNDQHPLLFDTSTCPPWNLDKNRREKDSRGLFPHPLYPSDIPKRAGEASARYAQLLAVESVNMINEALCERHRAKCPKSWELARECMRVRDIASMLDSEFAKYKHGICHDGDHLHCAQLANVDGCSGQWLIMSVECRKTCGYCFDMLQPIEATDDTSLETETVEGLNVTSQVQGSGFVSLTDTSVDALDQTQQDNKRISAWLSNTIDVDALILDNMSVVEFQRKCRQLSSEELRKNRECAKWIITEGLELVDDQEKFIGVVHTRQGIDNQMSRWMVQMPLICTLAFVFVWITYTCRWKSSR